MNILEVVCLVIASFSMGAAAMVLFAERRANRKLAAMARLYRSATYGKRGRQP